MRYTTSVRNILLPIIALLFACAADPYQTISVVRRMRFENTKLTHDAIREMQKLGVRTYPLPDSIMSALRSAWNEVRSEMAAKNPVFSDLVKSMTAYENSAPRPDLSVYGL